MFYVVRKKPNWFLQVCTPSHRQVESKWLLRWSMPVESGRGVGDTEGRHAEERKFIYLKKKYLPSPGKCLIFPWQFSDLLQSSQRWCQTNPVSVFGGRCSPQSMPKCLGQKVAKVCKWQGYVSCRWEIASYMGIVRTELQWEQLRK